MKRYGLPAALLVVAGASIGFAQRSDSPKVEPTERVLSDLEVGDWIEMDLSKERIPIWVIEREEGKSIAEKRDDILNRRQAMLKARREADSAYEDAGERFEATPTKSMRDELEAARKQRDRTDRELASIAPVWEVADIQMGFFRATNGPRVICIPESSIRFILKDR